MVRRVSQGDIAQLLNRLVDERVLTGFPSTVYPGSANK